MAGVVEPEVTVAQGGKGIADWTPSVRRLARNLRNCRDPGLSFAQMPFTR